jgi:hypothetical protein
MRRMSNLLLEWSMTPPTVGEAANDGLTAR